MGFVRTSNQDDDSSASVGAGAPPFPGDPDSIDWSDPELVKVHYDVSAWDWEQRAELSETLAERNVPHMWASEQGVDELVVPELAEDFTDALFEQLEAELGPFPIALDPDDTGTEFALDDWPEHDLEALRTALLDAEIPHRWRGPRLITATDAADAVDDLLDAIEAGEVASADGTGAPDGALHDLYALGDELARDPDDSAARARLTTLVGQLSPEAPPYGLAGRAWGVIVGAATALDQSSTGDDRDAIVAAADELRAVTRPYV